MRTLLILATLALLLPLAASPAEAWLPVCKDKDVRTGIVNVHVGVDCYPGVWVEVCPDRRDCDRSDLLS